MHTTTQFVNSLWTVSGKMRIIVLINYRLRGFVGSPATFSTATHAQQSRVNLVFMEVDI